MKCLCQQARKSRIDIMAELDPDFAPFLAKWRERVRMKESDAPAAFMRAEQAKAGPVADLTQTPGETGIYVEVDGRGFAASGDPSAMRGMADEWRAILDEERPSDERAFTKHFVKSIFAHAVEAGPAWSEIMCAAVWLASSNPQAFAMLEAGNVTLDVKFTFDDAARVTRMRMEVLLPMKG